MLLKRALYNSDMVSHLKQICRLYTIEVMPKDVAISWFMAPYAQTWSLKKTIWKPVDSRLDWYSGQYDIKISKMMINKYSTFQG